MKLESQAKHHWYAQLHLLHITPKSMHSLHDLSHLEINKRCCAERVWPSETNHMLRDYHKIVIKNWLIVISITILHYQNCWDNSILLYIIIYTWSTSCSSAYPQYKQSLFALVKLFYGIISHNRDIIAYWDKIAFIINSCWDTGFPLLHSPCLINAYQPVWPVI